MIANAVSLLLFNAKVTSFELGANGTMASLRTVHGWRPLHSFLLLAFILLLLHLTNADAGCWQIGQNRSTHCTVVHQLWILMQLYHSITSPMQFTKKKPRKKKYNLDTNSLPLFESVVHCSYTDRTCILTYKKYGVIYIIPHVQVH